MKTIAHRLVSAAVLVFAAGSASAGGNPWLDTGNTAVSNNILGAVNNVPVNITSNSQTILQVGYSEITSGLNTYSGGTLVGGFWGNQANANACTVLGGYTVSVSGGGTFNRPNLAQDFGCSVIGGADNSAGLATGSDPFAEPFATVVGGIQNQARGAYSTVIGGIANEARGYTSVSNGGSQNRAGGDYSMAGGFGAVVRDSSGSGDSTGDEGCFVWADRSVTSGTFTTTAPNQFLIRATGGVGIGTNTPRGRLECSGADAFNKPQIVMNASSGSWSRMGFTNSATGKFWHFAAKCDGANPGEDQLNYYYQDTAGSVSINPMQIRGDGRIAIGGGVPETGIALKVSGTVKCTSLIQTSSQRYKTDVATLPSVLDRFLQLRPVSFTWDKDHGGDKDVGLIAEEVAAVFPEAVATIDGKVEGINFSRVTALAIQAVKEQQEKVAAGQERLTRLEAENAELKARLERIEKALAK